MDTHRKYVVDPKNLAVAVGLFIVLWAIVVFFSRVPSAEVTQCGGEDAVDTYDRHDVLVGLLYHTSGALRKQQIPHWLMSRTLLGWMAGKRILRDDYDVDLGILEEHKGQVIEVLVNELPGNIYSVADAADLGVQVIHTATGLSLELTQYADNNGILRATTPCQWLRRMYNHQTQELQADWIFPVKGGMLNGIEVPIPAQPQILLQNWYGIQGQTNPNVPLSHPSAYIDDRGLLQTGTPGARQIQGNQLGRVDAGT
jgi:hypothetical protein